MYGYTNLHLAIIVFIGIWFISYPYTYVMFAYVYIQARVKLLDVNLLGQSVEKSIFFFFFLLVTLHYPPFVHTAVFIELQFTYNLLLVLGV